MYDYYSQIYKEKKTISLKTDSVVFSPIIKKSENNFEI